MCVLECHLNRSGKFLDRASSLYPSLPGELRMGKGFTDWKIGYDLLLTYLTVPHSQIDSWPKGTRRATEQGWGQVRTSPGLSAGSESLPMSKWPAEGMASIATASGRAREPRAQVCQGHIVDREGTRET